MTMAVIRCPHCNAKIDDRDGRLDGRALLKSHIENFHKKKDI